LCFAEKLIEFAHLRAQSEGMVRPVLHKVWEGHNMQLANSTQTGLEYAR